MGRVNEILAWIFFIAIGLDSFAQERPILNLEISGPVHESIKASSFFSDFKSIRLSNDVLVGRISKVLLHKSKIYLHDQKQNSLYCFDLSGNFMFQFSKKGRGPGEYGTINDFDIYTSSDKIIVLTDNSYLIELDLNLKPINKDRIKLNFHSTNLVTSGRITIYHAPYGIFNNESGAYETYDVVYQDNEYDVVEMLFKNSKPSRLGYSTNYVLFKSDSIAVTLLMNYSIYIITEDGISSEIRLDYGSRKFDTKRMENLKNIDEWIQMTDPEGSGKGKVKLITRALFCKNLLHFTTVLGDKGHPTIYDFKENKSYLTKKIDNDLFPEAPFGAVIGASDGMIITHIDPIEVIRQQKLIGTNNLKVSENDNPILGIYSPKR